MPPTPRSQPSSPSRTPPAAAAAPARPGRRARSAKLGVLLFAVVALSAYAGLAWVAVQSKSPTYDEPLHAVGAWLHLHHGDFRVNPEDPPLWHYWAALPNGPGALQPEKWPESYAAVAGDVYLEWRFVVEALFRTPGVDAEAFVTRSRAMMLVLATALGGMLIAWSYRLGGAVAAVAAGVLYCFDPSFIGHGPLVKNDVPFTLVTVALAFAVWRAGVRLTPWNALAVCLLCAAAVTTKFSGLLLGPVVTILLVTRALMRDPWAGFGRNTVAVLVLCFAALSLKFSGVAFGALVALILLAWALLRARSKEAAYLVSSRPAKLGVALGLCVAAAVVSYVAVWGAYRFRYQPTPQDGLVLNTGALVDYVALNQLHARHPGVEPTPDEVRAWRPGLFLRGVLWAEQNRVLPQAYTNGLVYTYQSTFYHQAFLLGRMSYVGWWYYFPVAFVLKAPVSLWVTMIGTVGVGIATWRARRRSGTASAGGAAVSPVSARRPDAWAWICLLVPPGIYLLSAMGTNLNIGVRHIFPTVPFLYLLIALAAAEAWRRWPRPTKAIGLVLGIGFMVEAMLAMPNYIAFFNAALGGPRGGVRLLGDSNLDWGQDLKLLAEWQDANPDRKLYLAYFGIADPTYYRIDYANLPGGYFYGTPKSAVVEPGVIAVSATILQGIYLNDAQREMYRRIRQMPLIDVLGGTIYLFEYGGPSAVQ